MFLIEKQNNIQFMIDELQTNLRSTMNELRLPIQICNFILPEALGNIILFGYGTL